MQTTLESPRIVLRPRQHTDADADGEWPQVRSHLEQKLARSE